MTASRSAFSARSFRSIVGVVATLALAATTFLVLAVPAPAGAAPMRTCGASAAAANPLAADEQQLVDLLNGLRRSVGKSTLAVNLAISDQARGWSGHMSRTNVLQHARSENGIPAGYDYVEQITAVLPDWSRVGENVGRGGSVQSLHDAFAASSGHYANMVGDFNQVGIGIVRNGPTIWVTVRFAKGSLPATPAHSASTRTVPSRFVETASPGCAGQFPITGDFDGNGYDDVLLYGPGGMSDELIMNTASGPRMVAVGVNGNFAPFVGDFDGDGRDDIFWYAAGPSGDYLWYGSGNGSFVSTNVPVNGNYQPLIGDFDGNGRDDIFWYAAGPAGDYFWYSTGRSFFSRQQNANLVYAPMVADFDANGYDDIFWYAAGPAGDYLWYNTNRGVDSRFWPVNGRYQPQLGDYDGDGRADIFWYAPGTAPDFIWYLKDRQISSHQRNVNGSYDVMVGDFDGSGTSDIFFFSPSAGMDTLWSFGRQRNAVTADRGFISGGFETSVGDFNADGRDDIYWHLPGGGGDAVWSGR